MPRLHAIRGALPLALVLVPAAVQAQKTIPPAGVMPTAAPVMAPSLATPPSGFIAAINGRVSSVRFYEGPYSGTPSGQRVFFTTFQRALSRYIYWQLDVAFPNLQNPVRLPVDAIWYRQDGSVFARQMDDTLSLQPGWSSAWQTRGRGWNDNGNWPVGPYWIDLFVHGERVANGSFTMADGGAGTYYPQPPSRPVNAFVPALNARITSVKFFEAGGQAPPKAQRSYQTFFTGSQTRYVYWEMNLQFPYAYQRQNFAVEAIWYSPDGSVFARQQDASFYLDQSWTQSDHTWGRGWDNPGQWTHGTYYVELFVNGVRVGYDRFIVG